MKNKIQKVQKAMVGFWKDERGVGETADRAIWLVLGIGAATLAAFSLIGGLRGKFGGTFDALDDLRAVNTPITPATTSTVTLGTGQGQTGIIPTATGN